MKWSGAIPRSRIFAPDSEPRGSGFFRPSVTENHLAPCPLLCQRIALSTPNKTAPPCPNATPPYAPPSLHPVPCPALERRSSCSRKGAHHPPCSRRWGSPRLTPFSVPTMLAPMMHAPASALLVARPTRAVEPALSAHALLVACPTRADEAHVELTPPTLVEQCGCFTKGTAWDAEVYGCITYLTKSLRMPPARWNAQGERTMSLTCESHQ
jgi:hypothetical protein